VIAIIITIMVLEMKPPHEATVEALYPLAPVLLSYILSYIVNPAIGWMLYIVVAIMWLVPDRRIENILT